MFKQPTRVSVTDPAALDQLERVEDLRQRALQADAEIRRLLEPLREQLSALVLEHDRLSYEALAARQKFFQLVKKAHSDLGTHGGLRYEKTGDAVQVVWDDAGPRFSAVDSAELPGLHPFESRASGRRATDLMNWLS